MKPTMVIDPKAGIGDVPSVADRLLASSTRFARSAIEAYVEETWDVFYLHLSTAVEHLLKSVLAAIHPTLIADKAADFETLLHLTGNKALAATPESAARTVNVTEAIRRVGRVLPGYRQATSRVTFLLDMRNGVVHAGHTVRAEHQAVLGEVATFVDQLIASRGLAAADYWGTHADLVADHGKRRLDVLEATYQRKVRAALDSHRRTFEPLSDEEQSAFLDAREPRELADDYDTARATCPACGHTGVLTGEPEPDWEADWDTEGGEAYVDGAYVDEVRLYATSFACDVCSLTLDAEQLVLAGLATVVLTEDDADLDRATEYFTRRLAEDEWES